MPIKSVRGIDIAYDDYGSGSPVVLLSGTGGRGREWVAHQVPALTSAGYRAITIDNRGTRPSDSAHQSFTIDDMVTDTIDLITSLNISDCRIIGFSLGGIIALEALLANPGLFTQAVIMGTRGRTNEFHIALSDAIAELEDSGTTLPPKYDAIVRAMQYLSPRTLNDRQQLRDWLDIFELVPQDVTISRNQRGLDLIDNRLEAYRKISANCLIIGFADDLVVSPHFCREIAESIPQGRYEEVAGCGHYGHLEQPTVVNQLILDFFRGP
jgi:pimeloyl-ACP methyl ester carboxylesterase